MQRYLEFERPIAELERQINELRQLSERDDVNIVDEVTRLQAKLDRLMTSTYGKLTAWQKTQLARHGDRPHSSDYIARLIDEFLPLAGDRVFGEDHAVIGGLGSFRGRPVVVLGHEKGADTDDRVRHNFGMARPEGYRKAARLMGLADRFSLPVITLIDTSGAYPGVGAEERGQSEAIARSIETCLAIGVPLVAAVIGEGGSGGAVAMAVGDRIFMLEHAVYSVISPEGCASILWRSGEQVAEAAEALRLTAADLLRLGVIDEIINEPEGGAHRDPEATIDRVGDAIAAALDTLAGTAAAALRHARRDKFLAMGRKGLG